MTARGSCTPAPKNDRRFGSRTDPASPTAWSPMAAPSPPVRSSSAASWDRVCGLRRERWCAKSILLTDTLVGAGAVIDRAIIDKRVRIGANARVGGASSDGSLKVAMVGKNSNVPPGYHISAGAVIATDVIIDDYPSENIREDDYIQTRRLPYEV